MAFNQQRSKARGATADIVSRRLPGFAVTEGLGSLWGVTRTMRRAH